MCECGLMWIGESQLKRSSSSPFSGCGRMSTDSPVFRFYGAECSYFTGKARPALRAKRLYFEEILPTPEAYKEILRRTGMIFIPVVVTPEDETWQDTSEIIDALETRFPEPAG